MRIGEIRDLDALDVLFVLAGAVLGGVLGAVGWAALAPSAPVDAKVLGMVAVACGVSAIKLRRAYRKPSIENRDVEPPPLVSARSLLSGVLVGVGALVCLAGLGLLVLMISFVTSEHGKQIDGAAAYLLLPAAVLVVGALMVWMGLRRPAPGSPSE